MILPVVEEHFVKRVYSLNSVSTHNGQDHSTTGRITKLNFSLPT